MQLTRIQLLDFRNHADTEIVWSEGVNCIVGDNGSGKTNVLDAIHYLCHTKSYFHATDAENIAHEAPHLLVSGRFIRHGEEETVSCAVERGIRKIMRRNDKVYDRIRDHIGRFPAVMVAPDDTEIVLGGSEMRRKWMDSVISQLDREYLEHLVDYGRALTQRNNLLRYFAENRVWDPAMLEPWDARLAPRCAAIHARRMEFMEEFRPEFEAMHAELSGGVEHGSIGYASEAEMSAEACLAAWEARREDDRRARRTTWGVHRDDVELMLDSRALRKFGSQGQHKTFLIAIRLGQWHFLARKSGLKPLLLLDDVFDKMDVKRMSALLRRISDGTFGQVFITDTHAGRVPELLATAGAAFEVVSVARGTVQK
jgi:DNA replication and repair protein RecF